MRILLVNPPRSPHNGILEHAPAEALRFIHKKLIGPPLGLLTVAASVRDHDVFLLEMKGEYDLDPDAPPPRRLMRRWLEETRPDVVGTTVITSEYNAGMEILDEAKRFDPSVLTVAGGLHATLCAGDFAGGPADVVCQGHSAPVFAKVVRARESGTPLEAVGGIFLNAADGYGRSGAPAPEVDAARRDFVRPDRSLVERWIETYRVGKSAGPATYVFTSLGCPYGCTFCSIWPMHGGTYSPREVESIVEELASLDDYPVVRFADANTLVDARFVERLFDRIEEEGIRKQYIMDMRTDAAVSHPRLIEKLARNGLAVVVSGFESFRDEELDRYKKTEKASLIHEAIRVFHDNGVMIRGNYMVPPEYGRDDFAELAEYAASHRVAYAGYTILTPMPGTSLYREVEGEIVDRDLDKYNFFNCVLEPKLPIDEFYERVASLWTIKEGTDVI